MILSGRRVFGPDIGKIDLPQLLKEMLLVLLLCEAEGRLHSNTDVIQLVSKLLASSKYRSLFFSQVIL